MTGDNLILYVASYDDPNSAEEDYQALQEARADDLDVVGAVVMNRDADGEVNVATHKTGEVGGGATLGAAGGLVVGLFAPPLLLSTAIGSGIGAAIGALVKKHEEKELGVAVDDYLPNDSSAIVAVVDDRYLDRIDAALERASKKVQKAIDKGDYDKLEKALADAADSIDDAIDS